MFNTSLPIISMTSDNDLDFYRSRGMTDHIAKPLNKYTVEGVLVVSPLWLTSSSEECGEANTDPVEIRQTLGHAPRFGADPSYGRRASRQR